MSEEQFIKQNGWYDVPYTQKCTGCGKEHIVYTQQDSNPEYHTQVYIVCECNEMVEFNLPVN